jgi:hypothetical protein
MLYAYEADVLPYRADAGWIVANPCESICSDFIEGGHFVLEFDHPPPGDSSNYHLWIAQSGNPFPLTLWVEWNYRSNHPLGPNFDTCDGRFSLKYRSIHHVVYTYGNAAISWSGVGFVWPLDLYEFHTYRFESHDGMNYSISVDGQVFILDSDNGSLGAHYLQFGSNAGTCHDWVNLPFVRNEWDFIRYGTIGFGERIVAADPPMGFLDASTYATLDRFVVTYDSPNYVYINDIAVEVSCSNGPPCPPAPQVIATKRLDNGPADVLQIILDRPLPPSQRTTFTFTDVNPSDPANPSINTVAYTFQLGDVNADGHRNLRDFASLQNCYLIVNPVSICAAFDFNANHVIDPLDYVAFRTLMDE